MCNYHKMFLNLSDLVLNLYNYFIKVILNNLSFLTTNYFLLRLIAIKLQRRNYHQNLLLDYYSKQ